MGKISIKQHRTAVGLRWVVSRFVDGRRRRSHFKLKSEAQALADELRDEVHNSGQLWTSLPASERSRLIAAYTEARERGLDLRDALDRTDDKPQTRPILPTAIDELIESKTNAGRSDSYTKILRTVLDQFAASREHLTVEKISLADVESFLDSKRLAYRSTLRARLSTLFNFCVRRGYRADNPCTRLESVTYVKPPPRVFTVKQFGLCMTALSQSFKPSKHSPTVSYRHARPWFVLTTLCGLRPEEAEKTTAADINFKEGWVKVEAQTTKVRQRRIVYPRREAMVLLGLVIPEGRLPIDPQARLRALHHLRTRLGFKVWPKDITRHTAASYWLALDGSAAHVAEMLGNSESVLKRDYKALVTKKEAAKFWDTMRVIALRSSWFA